MHLSDSTLYETLNLGDGFPGCQIFLRTATHFGTIPSIPTELPDGQKISIGI